MIYQTTFILYFDDVISVEYGADFPGREQLDKILSVTAWNARWSFEYPDAAYFGEPDFPTNARKGSVVNCVATLVSHDYCFAMWPSAFFLPRACVQDCTVPGRDASEAVRSWMQQDEIKVLFMQFTSDELRAYCKQEGAWDDTSTVALDEIKERCLWVWCGECREQRDQGEVA